MGKGSWLNIFYRKQTLLPPLLIARQRWRDSSYYQALQVQDAKLNQMLLTEIISRHCHWIAHLSIVAALLAWPQSRTLAQSLFTNPKPTEIYQLSTPQKLIIPPLAPSEISPAATTESVANEQDLLTPPQLNAVITREFPALWQMWVPTDQVASLRATYEFKSESGQANQFSREQHSGSGVSIVLEPLPILEIARDQNTNTVLVQGGVRLKMDLSTAQSAGAYAGELTVTVNR
ncbi:MAG: hypothetical protein N2235_02170 [Fischerella sp.]|nr:hypothetical protein [Fischerella sp.]